MREMRRSVAATGFVLAAFGLATTNLLANSGGDFREGQEVTVVLPATSCEKVEKNKKNQPGETYEVVMSVDDRGQLVLGNDPMWRSKSLPVVVNGVVSSIKKSRKTGKTTLTFMGTETTFIFRIPTDSPWQQLMTEVLIDGHWSVAAPSQALSDSLTRTVDAYCKNSFSAPLDALKPETRHRVAGLQLAVGALEPPSTSSIDDEVYLDAQLGAGPAVFDRLRTSADQRITRTITGRVLPAVKAWAQLFYGDVPFDGFRFTATITNKDFAEYPPQPAYEELEIFLTLKEAKAFAGDNLTPQELIDAAIVLVNGSRSHIDL